ncbi:unnamed protein product [Ambrosiozyma monospora]|uniref:Unnamed protein product n=1 Tax=Ambrosiozyma monospora TaxID=43982 RepID=A0ACB5TD09_AMBMO|nr:unnamed protein product [Ambrosiozyma monospora]
MESQMPVQSGLSDGPQSLEEVKNLYLGDDPTDYSKWMLLIESVIKIGNVEFIRDVFDSYISIFRNDGKILRAYIEFELSKENHKKAEQLFQKGLTKIYDVELWLCYLNYVKKINNVVLGGEQARNTVLRAYNFAIDNVGLDFLNSQPLWNDYFTFMTTWEPANNNEAQSKTDLTRSLIRKAISIPLKYLEDNWKLYISFENETSPATARKTINEKSPEYMKLRPLVQELNTITKNIKPITKRVHLKKQLKYWTDWITWEKQNKLKLPPDQVEKRVNYVYRLSTEYLRFHPEVWYNYAYYLSSIKRPTREMLEIIRNETFEIG